ncbi:MAG: hypothetical protein ACQER9_04435 [Nanobdellota archaeon]
MKLKNFMLNSILSLGIITSPEIVESKTDTLEEVVENKKNSKGVESKKLDKNPLFEKCKNIKGIHVKQKGSYDPEKQTVLIYADIHSSPEKKSDEDYPNLEKIRKATGINDIAVEGLAKKKENQKDPGLKTGEISLLEKLLNNENYNIVPLENQETQRLSLIANYLNIHGLDTEINAYKSLLAGYKMNIYEAFKNDNQKGFLKNIEGYKNICNSISNEKQTKSHLINEMLSKLKDGTLKEEYKVLKQSLDKIKSNTEENGLEINDYFDIASHYFELEKKLDDKYIDKDPFNNSLSLNYNKIREDIILDKRDKIAAKNYRDEFKDKQGIIFFGFNHREGIAERLEKDYNIVIIYPDTINKMFNN